MAQDMDESRKPAAVYVSWVTFKNAIERLAEGVPNQVDRTAFPGLSWAVQGQLLAGMRFLGLIDGDDKPTVLLHGLAVPDESTRKKKLEAILRARYGSLFDLDLMKATPAQVEDHLGTFYGVGGDTRGKAMRFFLAALEYLEIPVSRYLKNGNGTSGGSRRRRPARSKETPSDPESSDSPSAKPAHSANGMTSTVTFKNGDTLTVSASLNLFSLDEEERAFALELIDKMRKYEQTHQEGGRTS